MFSSDWKLATLDYNRTPTEFTGDDVDRFTDLVDLEENYEFLTVFIPALSTSGTVTPYIQRDSSKATVPMVVITLDDNATGHFAHATSSGAGSIVAIFRIGGARYVRLYVGANQTADRIFYIKGFNRMTFGT